MLDPIDIIRRTEALLSAQGWRADGDAPEQLLLRDCRYALAELGTAPDEVSASYWLIEAAMRAAKQLGRVEVISTGASAEAIERAANHYIAHHTGDQLRPGLLPGQIGGWHRDVRGGVVVLSAELRASQIATEREIAKRQDELLARGRAEDASR